MKKFNAALAVLLAIVCFVLGAGGGYVGYFYLNANRFTSDVYVCGDIQIHFLELGNKYTGDCTYIKAGDTDILIDAGSRTGSIPTISNYINNYVADGKLEYVIVTHAHEDHYSGFATNESTDSLFDLYECENIITFALTNQKESEEGKAPNMYSNFLRELNDEVKNGANYITAKECIEQEKNVYDLAEGITMTILDQQYYYKDSDSENDYSVCTLITYGSHNFIFTGDLEEKGEKSLIDMNTLPEVDLYKAGHHGSKTSSCEEFMAVIKPEVVCVCCCAGSSEYTSTNENQFPTQIFVDNVAPYTDKVYVTTLCVDYANNEFTSMNGNITVTCGAGIEVKCSNNDTKLKDTEWFKKNRTLPDAWK